MAQDDPPPALPPPQRHRWGPAAGVAAVVLVAAMSGLWLARKPIATAVIDQRLAEAHVRARYRIATLSTGRQRLVDVVIGDPAHPDLTARWLELGTRIGWNGATVTAVRGQGVRLRAALVDGRLSLGSIDRLLPSSPGKRSRLPAIDLDLADAQAVVATPAGPVRMGIDGRGRLDGGFAGTVTLAAPTLVQGNCVASGVTARMTVATRHASPRIAGPIDAARLGCGPSTLAAAHAQVDAVIAADLRAWRGTARWTTGRVATPVGTLAGVAGHGLASVAADGLVRGWVDAVGSGVVLADGTRARQLVARGRYRLGDEPGFAGTIGVGTARLADARLRAVTRMAQAAAGTPLAPLTAHAAGSLIQAARAFDAVAAVDAGRAAVRVSHLVAHAATGARLTAGGAGHPAVVIRPGDGAVLANAAIAIAGGGLPTAGVRMTRAADGTISGIARVAPYAAGGARLALTPLRWHVASDGSLRVDTVATLSGPLPQGRVDKLTLPVSVRRDAARDLMIGPGCAAIGFDRLTVASLRLDGAQVPICPTGPALVRIGTAGISVDARLGRMRITGMLGHTPLMLATTGGMLSWARRGGEIGGVEATLGNAAAPVRITAQHLYAMVAPGGIAGRFAGAGGRIGSVPLLLSDAAGTWRVVDGALSVRGDAMVADTAAPARFKPMRAQGVTLSLANGTIRADARLVAPSGTTPVATVVLAHDLSSGTGRADLHVPGVTFTEAFQPDDLTPLTFGVIAGVRGTVAGDAHLAWSDAGITSTGRFGTDRLDLAAAFGPVTGIAGTIDFTDLLALRSAPHQIARIATVNPGIAVENGRIAYQLLPDARVLVEDGHWPFAGGALDLLPTTLDFATAARRHLTFTLAGVDAGQFLQQFDFKNIAATGTFDGALPMVFDTTGGRIEGGHLHARAGGGSLAYLGDLSQKDLGFWGNLAFQSLRSVRYRDLGIVMNGPLAGEMVTEVRFAGLSQGAGARSNFLIRRLQRLPLVFNIRIKAPFRGLIDSAQSFYDPTLLVRRNLPTLLQQQGATAIQPPASENTP